VAIKVIDKVKLSDPNEQKRIQREIKVLRRLNHESVIRLFEVIDSEPKMWLVMEYAPGGSLLDYVRARKRLPEPEAAYFFQQIVAGLRYCHESEVRTAGPWRGLAAAGGARRRMLASHAAAACACPRTPAGAASKRGQAPPDPAALPLPCRRRWCTATSSWRTSCWTAAPP
jgi:hypothetical protein